MQYFPTKILVESVITISTYLSIIMLFPYIPTYIYYSYMICLFTFQLCVILEPMQELMSRHKAYALSPRDCLKTTLFQKWQKMVAPPGMYYFFADINFINFITLVSMQYYNSNTDCKINSPHKLPTLIQDTVGAKNEEK